jgi:glycosyltransferase involved in cell wall biosynthesis
MHPKITIMIPTYNQANFIGKAVESALAQDYSNLEVIVSDDCSTDNTYSVIQKYISDERFKYFKNDHNIGRVANYHKNLYELASGEWVLNLDGDDYFYDNDVISHLASCLLKNNDKNIVAVIGGTMIRYSEKDVEWNHKINSVLDGFDLFLKSDKITYNHGSILYHRETAKTIGYYQCDILSADKESYFRLLLNGKVILTGKIISVWRRTEITESSSLNSEKLISNLQYIEDPYQYTLKHKYDKIQIDDWKKRMLKNEFEGIMRRSALTKEYKIFFQTAFLLYKKYPSFELFLSPKIFAAFMSVKFSIFHSFLRNIYWLVTKKQFAPKEKH